MKRGIHPKYKQVKKKPQVDARQPSVYILERLGGRKSLPTGWRQKTPLWKMPAGGTWWLESRTYTRLLDFAIWNPTVIWNSYALSLSSPSSAQCHAQWTGRYCGLGQAHKARELNAAERWSPWACPALPGAQLTKQPGLSAWAPQKGVEERPFLNTRSIGALSLWTKSEFGAGKCCVQWPEQNERGWPGSIFSVCAFATGGKSFGSVSRRGNPRALACLLRAPWGSALGWRWKADKNDCWVKWKPSLWRRQNSMGSLCNKVGDKTSFYSITPAQPPSLCSLPYPRLCGLVWAHLLGFFSSQILV